MSSSLDPSSMPVPSGSISALMMSSLPNKLPPIHAPSIQAQFHPGNPYESSSTATTASPRSPNGAPTSSGLAGVPRSADARSFQQGHVPPPPENVQRYSGDYDSMMVSPPGYDQYRGPRMEMLGGSPHLSHSIPAHLQQKRAYRQRRKDPSCDACRERKVKCDATDTSSCSECSSRNVKCQFTKETNRRMSSIKQVQDLEKQLNTTKDQLSRYEALLRSKGIADTDAAMADDEGSLSGSVSPSKRRKLRPSRDDIQLPVLNERIQQALKPFLCDEEAVPVNGAEFELDSPAGRKALTDFFETPFSQPGFVNAADAMTAYESKATISKMQWAVLAGCIACSALRTDSSVAEHYHQSLLESLDIGLATLDTIRATLLSAIYLYETNRSNKSFAQMGLTVAVAQTLGLQRHIEELPARLREERWSLWVAIVCWERSMALGSGRPSLIQDNDLGVALEDITVHEDDNESLAGLQRVAKIASQVYMMQREDIIPEADLAHIDQTLSLGASDERGVPRIPWAKLHLLDSLLIIHRHHISPFVPEDSRYRTAETCKRIASGTARILESAQQQLDAQEKGLFHNLVRAGPAAKLIKHLWRCVLLSLYAGEVQVALDCGKLLASIADTRPIGKHSGQHLAEFLKIWKSRVADGLSALMSDVAVITYASADAQFSHQHAWAPGIALVGAKNETPVPTKDEAMANGIINSDRSTWDELVDTLEQLPQPPSPAPPPLAQASDSELNGPRSGRVDSGASTSNRLKIADLMG